MPYGEWCRLVSDGVYVTRLDAAFRPEKGKRNLLLSKTLPRHGFRSSFKMQDNEKSRIPHGPRNGVKVIDPADKKARHKRDLEAAFRSNTALPLDRLLADVDYPSASHRAAFYAQSLSLVDYMTTLISPKDFVRFVSLSTQHGSDHALSVVYEMDTKQLSRSWKAQAATKYRQE